MKKSEEVIFRGRPLSRGIAIGKPWILPLKEKNSLSKKQQRLSSESIELEIEKYHNALRKSHLDLKKLHKMFTLKGEKEVPELLDAQIEILQDPLLTETVEKNIRGLGQPSHYAFHAVIQEYKNCFYSMDDHYFEDRLKDIVDVSNRVLKHLASSTKLRIPKKSILIGKEIFLTQIAEANPSQIFAFVTELGGIASHAAIIARSKRIPYVTNIDLKAIQRFFIERIIVDAVNGLVIINPTLQTLHKYETLLKSLEEHEESSLKERLLPACTQDDLEVELFASIDLEADLNNFDLTQVKGIGLVRSEFCFISSSTLPTEEEQFRFYVEAALKLNQAPFILRLFDVGGEKNFLFSNWKENCFENSTLRGIRFLLEEKKLLTTQLRAILKAFKEHKNIQILIPMVSDLSEILELKSLVLTLSKEFDLLSLPKIGCMIETPSSALLIDLLAREVDFMAVGTNDLTQYTLGIDRNHKELTLFHPAMLKLLKKIIETSLEYAKPLYFCGEMAQDFKALPFLLGLGVKKLTVNLERLPDIKQAIRKISLIEAKKNLWEAMKIPTAKELISRFG